MKNSIERLIYFIDFKGDSKYRFYKKTGLSNGFLDKNRNIGSDKSEIISTQYPDLNLEWLITGKGEMLKSNTNNETIQEKEILPTKNETIKDRVLIISKYYRVRKEIFFEALNISYANFKGKAKESSLNSESIVKILTKYNKINAEWLLFGNGEMVKNNNLKSEYNNELTKLQKEHIELLKQQNQMLQEKIDRILEDDLYREELQRKLG